MLLTCPYVVTPSGTSQGRSVHVPDHALMAVAFACSVASVCPPEKRKVDSSILSLTTTTRLSGEALTSRNVTSDF
jgi:hypothetical protein